MAFLLEPQDNVRKQSEIGLTGPDSSAPKPFHPKKRASETDASCLNGEIVLKDLQCKGWASALSSPSYEPTTLHVSIFPCVHWRHSNVHSFTERPLLGGLGLACKPSPTPDGPSPVRRHPDGPSPGRRHDGHFHPATKPTPRNYTPQLQHSSPDHAPHHGTMSRTSQRPSRRRHNTNQKPHTPPAPGPHKIQRS